jgi:hypothetical protein
MTGEPTWDVRLSAGHRELVEGSAELVAARRRLPKPYRVGDLMQSLDWQPHAERSPSPCRSAGDLDLDSIQVQLRRAPAPPVTGQTASPDSQSAAAIAPAPQSWLVSAAVIFPGRLPLNADRDPRQHLKSPRPSPPHAPATLRRRSGQLRSRLSSCNPPGGADSEPGRATGASRAAEPGAGTAASHATQRAADLTAGCRR